MIRVAARLALPLLALAAGCQPDVGRQLDTAREAYAVRHYDDARAALSPVLARDPGNAAARTLLARTALALGDGVRARAALAALPPGRRPADYALLAGEAQLMAEQPDAALAAIGTDASGAAERIRALALLAKGRTDAARAAFERGAAARPLDARLAADYAGFKLAGHDLHGARKLAEAALATDPGSIDVLLVTARCAIGSEDLRGALGIYDRALALYPGNLAAITGKAGVLGDLGRRRDMEAVLASAGGETRRNPDIVYVRARAAVAAGDWRGARAILEANGRLLRDNDAAAVLHAEVLSHLGLPEQARVRLTGVLRRDPDNAVVRRALARVELFQDDPRSAAATLAPLAGHFDAHPAAEVARPTSTWLAATKAQAGTALRSERWSEASALYGRVLAATGGTDPVALNNLAYAQGRLGHRARALGYAERALRSAPHNPSVMDTVALLLVETGGDRRRALGLLRAAARAAPGNAAIRMHLAALDKAT